MPQDVLEPAIVRVARWWRTIGPTRILPQPVASPVRHVERWVSEDVVKSSVLQFVLVEAALVVPPDVGVDAAHCEIHLGEAPRRIVRLLPVDRDVADAPAVTFDELLGLDEHATRPPPASIPATLVGLLPL